MVKMGKKISPKKWSKTLILAVMVLDHLTLKWAGTSGGNLYKKKLPSDYD